MYKPFFFAIAAMLGAVGMASAQDAILAVNEGVTYQDGSPASERYKPLLDMLARELKRPVKLQMVDKYSAFEKGLAEEKYDLAFVHPAHVGLQAIKKGTYAGLVTAKGYTDYRARVMVKKDSPLKTLADLRGKKVGVPATESITTVLFTANLRALKIDAPEKNFTVTRYQDAVPFMVENGFVEAGVTGSAAVEKAWVAKGGRVIGETKPVPVKQFIASKKLSDAERARVQNLLLSLSDSEGGKATLARIGMTGFVPWDKAVMDDAIARLGL